MNGNNKSVSIHCLIFDVFFVCSKWLFSFWKSNYCRYDGGGEGKNCGIGQQKGYNSDIVSAVESCRRIGRDSKNWNLLLEFSEFLSMRSYMHFFFCIRCVIIVSLGFVMNIFACCFTCKRSSSVIVVILAQYFSVVFSFCVGFFFIFVFFCFCFFFSEF